MEVEIRQQFDEMGIEPEPDVLLRCVDLALTYNVDDATEFVELWMAFSLSNLGGDSPNKNNLTEFERKILQAKRDKPSVAAKDKNQSLNNSVRNATPVLDVNPLAMYGVENDADEMMDEYMNETKTSAATDKDTTQGSHTPKGALPITPARKRAATGTLFSTVSYSPLAGSSSMHQTPGKSNEIVYTFGNPKLLAATQWRTKLPHLLQVKQLLKHQDETLNAQKLQYMYDNLYEKTEYALDRLLNTGESIAQHAFGKEASDFDWYQLYKGSKDNIKVVGTIHSEYGDGPLDAHSTVLVVPDKHSCRLLNLNFSKAKSVEVFPGQVVIASGTNPQGNMFVVEELLTERELKPPTPIRLDRELNFVIAAGPYTQSDDLIYDPLHELLKYLQDHQPDVLMLVGPFLNANHKIVSENDTIAETFESFYEKMVASIVEKTGSSTTILMVTSHKDANAYPVYPTPPVVLRKTYPNVHVLPDPSLIDLDGVTVGVTATDVVDHLLTTELAITAGDKAKRVVNYLLNQGTFYPLSPPPDEEMCLDTELAQKYAKVEQIPNILILPSSQKCFIRSINGCLAINPGRLSDGNSGTFARLLLTPTAPQEADTARNMFNCAACQIRRI